jgi:hypothetical protein
MAFWDFLKDANTERKVIGRAFKFMDAANPMTQTEEIVRYGARKASEYLPKDSPVQKYLEGVSKVESGKKTRDFATGAGREIAKVPETVARTTAQGVSSGLERLTGEKPDFGPLNFLNKTGDVNDPIRKILYGDDKVESYQTRQQGYEKTLEGSRFRGGATPLSFLGIGLMAAGDVTGFGGGKKELGEQLAKEGTEIGIKNILKRAGKGIGIEASDDVVRALKTTKDPIIANKILDERTVAPVVVQIRNMETGEDFYQTIKPSQLDEAKKLIDNTGTGRGAERINGEVYHITAKRPEDMELQGFQSAGVFDPKGFTEGISGAPGLKGAAQQSYLAKQEASQVGKTGNQVASEAKKMGSDQGGISDFTADQIKKEDYTTQTVSIDDLRKSDPDLNDYINGTKNVRAYNGEPNAMPPIVTSKGEVIDGYNRIHQAIVNGDKEITILKGNSSIPPQVGKTVDPTKEIVDGYADMLKSIDDGAKGGQMIPDGAGGYKRISENSPFYRDYYAQYGRAPSKAAYKEEALRQLDAGKADISFQPYYDDAVNPETKSLLEQVPEKPLTPEEQNLQSAKQLAMDAKKPIVQNAEYKKVPGETTGKQRDLGVLETTAKAPGLTKEAKTVAKKVEPHKYDVMSIDKTLDAARTRVTSDVSEAKKIVNQGLDSGRWDAQTSSHTLALIEKYSREGDDLALDDLLARAAPLAKDSGQANVLWRALANTNSAESMIKFANKTIDKANEGKGFLTRAVEKTKGVGDYKLSDDTKKYIETEMAKVKKLPDGPEKENIMKGILQKISDDIPVGASESFTAFRYQNMLSGPRSQYRNVVANLLQTFVTRPATLGVKASNDWMKSAITGAERTAYLRDVPDYYRGMHNSWGDAVEAMKGAWSGKVMTQNVDFGAIKGLTNQKIPKKYTVITRAMEAEDRFFQTLISSGEYAAQRAKGVPEDVARVAAEKVARNTLFRSPTDAKNITGQGALLSKIDQFTDIIIKSTNKVPALRWIVPFINTPMNITKQFIEYSPAGFATIYKAGGDRKAEQMAKALIGSTVTAIAAKAALDGNTTWAVPKNEKEREAFYASGKKPYSIKIGDKWVPMIFFGPFAYAMAIPASVKDANDRAPLDASAIDKLTTVMTGQLKFFSGQTYVQGVSDFVDIISGNSQGGADTAIAGILGQAIPLEGLKKYVATVVDPVYRKKESFADELRANTPFASKKLEAYTEPDTGEPSKRNISDYVLPYSYGIAKGDEATKEQKVAVSEFFRVQNKSSRLRSKANDQINEAVKAGDPAKAREIAAEYNKKYAESFKDWLGKYKDYSNEQLVKEYNSRKIRLTSSAISARRRTIRKSINDRSIYTATRGETS